MNGEKLPEVVFSKAEERVGMIDSKVASKSSSRPHKFSTPLTGVGSLFSLKFKESLVLCAGSLDTSSVLIPDLAVHIAVEHAEVVFPTPFLSSNNHNCSICAF